MADCVGADCTGLCACVLVPKKFGITSAGSKRYAMFDAALKALAQMFSPPFRRVLLKSIGLSVLLIILIGIGLHQLLAWLAEAGEGLASSALGPSAQMPLYLFAKLLSIAAVLGIVAGSIFLMP